MRRMNWLALAAIPVVALSLLAGLACGDDDNGGTNGSPAATASIGEKASPVAGGPEIDQQDLSFKPDKLTIKVGDVVKFKNSETALHTVDINGKNISGSMKKGDEFGWKFTSPGTFKITCDFHPQMHATITVQ